MQKVPYLSTEHSRLVDNQHNNSIMLQSSVTGPVFNAFSPVCFIPTNIHAIHSFSQKSMMFAAVLLSKYSRITALP